MSLKLYLITCELLEDADYVSLRERLRAAQARQVMSHQWALRSAQSAAELKEVFRSFLGPRDRIVVAEVGEERASRRAMLDLAGM